MAIQRPELDTLARKGPFGDWQDGVNPPALEPTPPDPHDPDMESRLAKLEGLVPNLATKVDVEGIRADLHKMDATIVRWMLATVLTLFLGFAGLFFTMQNSIQGALQRTAQPASSAPAQSPLPIVIQVPIPPQPQSPASTE